ncbi:hypothetical protein HYH03_011765 [Edaphochlamys debaryana]|uniref:Uncharacterized protein n=1 Tax=Edaphochlamys debaryana TaxID=47281 RepID=A0A835XWU3_9CHLO|nr:hypothetical protein HYH03_011765 [Edaphochlamys debaryana]|eukprot:KAG2489816.1 hypothetical protein HYH03_011765 [Edaphochlamys debaryana]
MIPTNIELPAPIYNAMKYAQLALYLAIYDAGWSRDWLRVGLVNVVEEHVLQSVFFFIMTAHAVVGLVAANFAAKSSPQYPPLSAGLQGFLFGTLGLYDVYLQVQDATAAAAAPAASGKRK